MQAVRPAELYTWNMIDGHFGLPKRPLTVEPGPLVCHVYRAGGQGWDGVSRKNDYLCVIVTSTEAEEQDSAEYERYFDEYRPFDKHKATCLKLDGGSKAEWETQILIRGMTSSQVDSIIKEVSDWHHAEIERLKHEQT